MTVFSGPTEHYTLTNSQDIVNLTKVNTQDALPWSVGSRQDRIHWLTFVPRMDASDCLDPVNKGHTIAGGPKGYHKGVITRETSNSFPKSLPDLTNLFQLKELII